LLNKKTYLKLQINKLILCFHVSDKEFKPIATSLAEFIAMYIREAVGLYYGGEDFPGRYAGEDDEY
jgi:hypothetical protein